MLPLLFSLSLQWDCPATGGSPPEAAAEEDRKTTFEPRHAAEDASETAFLRLPLHFEQFASANGELTFMANGPGYSLSLGHSQVALDLQIADPNPDSQTRNLPSSRMQPIPSRTRGPASSRQRVHRRVTMTLVESNADARPSPRKPLAAKANRFIGGDPTRWQRGLPLFDSVGFESVYPGIDVLYYGNQSQLEYDFAVAPGADPGRIRLRFSGIESLRVDARGDLLLSLAGANVRHRAPFTYQKIGEHRRPVPARYLPVAENEVKFEIGPYDSRFPLVIDPVLSYASYLGGGAADRCWAAATDGAGNLYVVGDTFSPALAGQAGALYSAYGGGNSVGGDAFLAKVNMEKNLLDYFTYLGGSGQDAALSVVRDGSGNLFIAGYTGSINFPVHNAVQSKIAGTPERRSEYYQSDAFITKLDSSGTNIFYSTYLGGDGEDEALGLAIDSSGSAYITGQTSSTNFPSLNSLMAYQGGDDVFVAKLAPSGRPLVYSMTLGGPGVDSGEGIAVDGAGAAVIVGLSTSTNFPVRAAFQKDHSGGYDALIFRLNPSGTELEFSTFLGGENDDYGLRLQLDSTEAAILIGQSYSTNFPTAGARTSSNSGNGDAFLCKLSKDGQSLVFSGYLGGEGLDLAWDVAVDAQDNIYLAGSTSSVAFPMVDAFQTNLFGFQDAFVAALPPDGSRLLYSSYFGGPGNEQGLGLAVEAGGTAYLVGRTFSSLNLSSFTNTFQPNFGGGGSDSFVARITPTPQLGIQVVGGSTEASWAAVRPAYALEIKEGLQRSAGWVRWTGVQTTVRGMNVVRLPVTKSPRFYRLVRIQ